VAAVIAFPARDMVEDHDTIACLKVGYALADCSDNTRGFMAEDAGGGMRAGGDFFQVRSADAATVNADEYFSGVDGRNRNGLHAYVVLTVIDGGEHGGGNRPVSFFQRDLSGNGHDQWVTDESHCAASCW